MEAIPKRQKTFTGCWTCRNRKVKCDLRKPECLRCEKSGFICAGYDLKLRWSQPVQFDKYGYQLSTPHMGEVPKDEQYFQRRTVGFVRYKEEYQTYDQMDKHLAVLHNNSTLVHDQTKMLGPFGVFRGRRHLKRKLEGRAKSRKKIGRPVGAAGAAVAPADARPLPASSIPSPRTNQRADLHSKDSAYPDINFFNSIPNLAQGNEWLSKDLIDDALLTASALNGDTHFLDFFNVSDPSLLPVQAQAQAQAAQQAHAGYDAIPIQNPPQNIAYPQQLPLHQQLQLPQARRRSEQALAQSVDAKPPPSGSGAKPVNQQQQNQDEMFNLLFHRNSHFEKQFPMLAPQLVRNASAQQTKFKLNSNNELHSIASPASSVAHDELDHSETDSGPVAANGKTGDTAFDDISIHAGASKMPSAIMEVVSTSTPLPQSLQIDNIPIARTSLHVHPMTRYLLNYYIEEVADMMTVIPLPKNPWKFIYFPRAMMAVGELGSVGKTSNARNCLLNALLAVSAFNLQSKFNRNSDEMKYYLNLGIQLRQQATIFLKNCLLDDVLNQKYKDVLVAVLSMVTVDMVWGTMSDCKLHLDICEKFISKKMETKKKLSSKALILHRIFSNLKLIQDSTSLDNIKKEEIYLNDENYKDFLIDQKSPEEYKSPSVIPSKPSKGVFHEKINDQGKIRIEYIVNADDDDESGTPQNYNDIDSPASVPRKNDVLIANETEEIEPAVKKAVIPAFIDITRTSFKPSKNKLNDHAISSDAFYGLPNSLILLFSEIVHLVRFKKYHEDNKLPIPDFFDKLASEIDLKLQEWTLEWKLYEDAPVSGRDTPSPTGQPSKRSDGSDELETELQGKKFLTKRHEGIFHHVLSFYHGLVIYFKRLVKNVNPMYLQEHVEKVMIHLNLIQAITENRTRDNKDLLIIPLFWQGFIAGSEAMTYFLQTGFKDWGTNISKSGIGSYWVARQIMLEVWRRKNTNEKRNSWCDVIKDWEMNVMLS